MSYFNSLSQFQQAQEAIQEHTQSMEQEALASKAQTLQDKFDDIQQRHEQLAGAITGFGAGIHGARRSYLKVKKGFQSLQEKAQNLKEKLTGEQQGTPDGENTGREGEENPAENRANGQEDDGDANAQAGDRVAQEDVDEQVADTDNPVDPVPHDDNVGDRQNLDPNEPDPASADADLPPPDFAPPPAPDEAPSFAPDAPPLQVNEEGVQIVGGEENPRIGNLANAPQEANPEANEGDANVRNNAPDVEEPEAPAPDVQGQGVNGNPASDNAGNGMRDLANEGENGGTIEDLAQDGGDVADQALKQGADQLFSKMGGLFGDAGSTALETAGAVADFLGPVGEVVGAGIALGTFFHNLFDKPKEDAQEDAIQQAPTAIAGKAGIDTSQLSMGNLKTNAIGTLV
jgi:hypothetical protein